ncbi:MAG: DUF5986 family protein [Caulobacteraceae bacterium]
MKTIPNTEIRATDNFISIITKCLCDAVGDDIREDIKSRRLITQNSTPSRIWDLINTNICERFARSDVIANPTKRGAWEFVPVFERSTGTIYSLMREQRFASLKKELPKRRNAHYIDAFVRSLNSDLLAPQGQISLFTVSFCNEDYIKEIVQKVINDLSIPNELVERHAIILFQSFNNELSSLRCCIVDSNLDIVSEANWSNYIKASEGVIVDQITNKTSAYNDPTSGLKFKQKAKDKLGQKTLTKEKNTSKDSRDAK